MPWFNVDDGFSFHRKAVRAGNAALGLWVRAGAWCARHLTDGLIDDEIVATMGTPAQAARLVKAGLWIRVEGGYRFHEWSEENRNLPREKVLAKRRYEANRKAKQRGTFSEDVQVKGGCPTGVPQGVPSVVPVGVPESPPLPTNKGDQDLRGEAPVGDPRERGVSGPNSTGATRLVADIIGRHIPSAVRTALAIEVARLWPEATPDELADALRRWDARTGIGPALLPGLLADIRKEARGATTRTTPTGPAISPTDAYAAQFLGLTRPPQPALRALPGGA